MNEGFVSKGERTRSEITEAAYHLFIKSGYHGTSMRQIAQGAGIALGGIYNHFSSKEDIFVSVLMLHHPYYAVLPAMRAARGDTIEAFVRDAAARMVGELENRQDFLNLMFIELVEFESQHIPLLFQTIFPNLMEFAQHFIEGDQELRPIPLPIVMRAFISLFFAYVITEIIIGRQMSPEMQAGALDYFVDIYLHGILVAQPEVR
jgi:AcrR family transcriptional regulator